MHCAALKEKRNEDNRALLFRIALPFVVVSLTIMIICMTISIYKKVWTKSHTISMAILVLCFMTELYIYFFVINQYEIVGDVELMVKLFNRTTDV